MFKRKSAKIVTIVAVMFILTTTAFAAGYKISATLRPDIKVVIDGTAQTFKDANGSVVYPISYNDTTYLPIRAIGGIMGKSVDWDGTTQTVYLGGKPNDMTHEQISDKLQEINNWVIGDLWNDAYVNIRDYVEYGTDCIGKAMTDSDVDALITKLRSDMEKKSGYDGFVQSLSDVGYSGVKSAWNTLMSESDKLYNKIMGEKPTAKNKNYAFNTEAFVEARNAFDDSISLVK